MTGIHQYVVSKRLIDAIKDVLGFNKLTSLQKKAFVSILNGKNVLIIAPTGSGKTEAALIPIFQKLLSERNGNGVKVLYITPLRALNRDMFRRFIDFSKYLGFRIDIRHGDTTYYQRRKHLKNPPDILITTPESLQALLAAPKMKYNLRSVKFVVVDEVHELLDNKRGTQLSVGLERLDNIAEQEVQRIGLSATINCPIEAANFLFGTKSKEYEIIREESERGLRVSIDFPELIKLDDSIWTFSLASPLFLTAIKKVGDTLNTKEGSICFVNTRLFAEIASTVLNELGFKDVGIHHSSLSKEFRVETESNFKDGKIRGIVATSSLELGIDIGHVSFVIQLGSPRLISKFLQRIGRSQHSIERPAVGQIVVTSFDDLLESISIINLAKKGIIEKCNIYKCALDVLVHQIVGIVLENQKTTIEDIWNILKNSYSFRNLGFEKFLEVLHFLNSLNYIKIVNKNNITFTSRSREYYYSNLSTIEESKKYVIIDTASGKRIGTIDEDFVMKELDEESVFIVAGRRWSVLEIDYEKAIVKVKAVYEKKGNIAKWAGELIPVSYEVAINVKNLLRKYIKDLTIHENYYENILTEAAFNFLKNTMLKLVNDKDSYYNKFIKSDIFIEYGDGIAIVYTFFGSKVNETLGYLLSGLLSARFGRKVTFVTDPYRIFLNIGSKMNVKYVIETLRDIDPDYIEILLKKILLETNLFLWKFNSVCKRMGIIKREKSVSKALLLKLLEIYRDTIVTEEAFNEIFQRILDIEKTKQILAEVKENKLLIDNKIYPLSLLSKITTIIGEYEESVAFLVENKIVENIVRKRLESRDLIFICLNCYKWITQRKVKFLENEIKCPFCGSKFIGISKSRNLKSLKKLIGKLKSSSELNYNDKKIYNNLIMSANLTLRFGKAAAYALAGEGIGVNTAARVLKGFNGELSKLILEIIKAEKNFMRTRQYWRSE